MIEGEARPSEVTDNVDMGGGDTGVVCYVNVVDTWAAGHSQ